MDDLIKSKPYATIYELNDVTNSDCIRIYKSSPDAITFQIRKLR